MKVSMKRFDTNRFRPLTPIMMKFSSLSMFVRLNFVLPEFCMSFVSFPAKITSP